MTKLSEELSDKSSLVQWNYTTLANEDLFEYLNGLWKGKKPSYINVKVLRNTNFNNDGTLSFDDVAELPVEQKQFITRKLVAGDILLERSGGGPKQPVGRVVYFGLPDENYSFSNFTTCIRVKKNSPLDSKFLLYYLLCFYNQGKTGELQQRTTGIRNLNFTDYKKTKVPIPLGEEQKTIVFVLSKLQEVIKHQEKIIEKTKELKRSLMYNLFTKGLRGEELQETEIGLMPKSWIAVPLGQTVEIVYGAQAAVAHALDSSIGTPIFTNINITNDGELNLSILRYYKVPEKKRDRLILEKGDILFNWRSGSKNHVGKTAIFDLDGEYTFSSFILRFRTKESINNVYLYWYLQFLKSIGYFSQYRDQSSVNSVFNASAASVIPIAVCNREEQSEIGSVLCAVSNKIKEEQNNLILMQNLFRSMLQLLMTGQVRVRDIDFEGVACE